MRVAVVGPGRVGTLVGTALARSGHRVAAVAGGSAAARARLAELVAGVRPYDDVAEAVRGSELVVLSVPDDAIAEVVTDLARADAFAEEQRVVHLAGSQGLAPLRLAAAGGARVAACHPAMTVPVGSTDPDLLVGVAWAVTASVRDRGWAWDLVTDLGGDAHDVADDRRVLYHAGLAVGANAVGAAVAVARKLLLAAGLVDPSPFLGPLVRASGANVLARGADALTGPVVRGDVGTIERHLDGLAVDVPALLASYRALTWVVLDQVRPALTAAQREAMEVVLGVVGGVVDAAADVATGGPADVVADGAPSDRSGGAP
jgi:predicted short-subunit dehydrogenase-like oxidoreductase (DUF2520 family)